MNKFLKKVVCISIATIILTGFTSCGSVDDIKEGINQSKKTENVLKSSDGKFQLSLPSDWKEDKDLNELASIQASNRQKEKYVAVISESNQDFARNIKLEEFAKVVRENMSKSVQNATITDSENITVNEIPGLAFEVQGEVEKVKARYYVVLLKGKNHYHQVITWTLNSKYSENILEMKRVAQSFKEL